MGGEEDMVGEKKIEPPCLSLSLSLSLHSCRFFYLSFSTTLSLPHSCPSFAFFLSSTLSLSFSLPHSCRYFYLSLSPTLSLPPLLSVFCSSSLFHPVSLFLSPPLLSVFLSFSLSHHVSLSLHSCLCVYLSLSFSLSLSLSLSPTPVSLQSFYLSRIPVNATIFLSPPLLPVFLSFALSHPVFLSLPHFYLSLSPFLSVFLCVALSFYLSLPPTLYLCISLFNPCLFFAFSRPTSFLQKSSGKG